MAPPVTEVHSLSDLRQRISDAGKETLIVCDFYADWCGPCKFIAPFFIRLADQFTNAIFCKINVDHCRDVMQAYGVRAMPTFVLLKDGMEVDRVQGANPEALQSSVSRHCTNRQHNINAAVPAERAFLEQFVRPTHKMHYYKDPICKTLALSIIPSERLIEESTVQGKVNRFILAKNLAEWFKGDFFTWTDSPTCNQCGEITPKETLISGAPSLEEADCGASRVEIYVCKCGESVRFPRYNDPTKLLETRTGRCGEWANCFTLCAAAMDFDVRYIYDITDHVWCELWIPEVERWVHVDPCENLVDAPLVYEKGWKKSLSYVIAYGIDHVCDVTWRYVLDCAQTVKKRTAVRETVLQNFLTKLCARMGKDADAVRQKELGERRLRELIEFLYIGKRKDVKEYGGRISGDEKWRAERGEVELCSGSPKKKNIVLRPNDQELASKAFRLTYDINKDVYDRGGSYSNGFASLVFKSKDVQRKREFDWKMVYLCRRENKPEAEICWTIDLTGLKARKAILQIKGITTYEDGLVMLTVCADDVCIRVPPSGELVFENPPSAMLQIKAHFSGGRGDAAFQHAQIFRAKLGEENGPQMTIEIELD